MQNYPLLEQKFTQTPCTLSMQDGHRIEGYASLFGECDGGGDIVQAGAYARSLERIAAEGRRVKMLWQHDPSVPIGVWDIIEEDTRGLKVSGRLIPETAKGAEAIALIAAGAIDGLSIGYRTIKASQNSGGGRHLQVIDLWEISLVTFPMLASARVSAKTETATARVLGSLSRALDRAIDEISDSGEAD